MRCFHKSGDSLSQRYDAIQRCLGQHPSPYFVDFEFQPERWIGRKPGTYEWIPFGGGIRRCLGAALAMAEQRVVLEATARRLDLDVEDPAPERALGVAHGTSAEQYRRARCDRREAR